MSEFIRGSLVRLVKHDGTPEVMVVLGLKLLDTYHRDLAYVDVGTLSVILNTMYYRNRDWVCVMTVTGVVCWVYDNEIEFV